MGFVALGQFAEGLLEAAQPEPVIGFACHHHRYLAQISNAGGTAQLHSHGEFRDQPLDYLADCLEAFAGGFQKRQSHAND